jgi:hypothetical protein
MAEGIEKMEEDDDQEGFFCLPKEVEEHERLALILCSSLFSSKVDEEKHLTSQKVNWEVGNTERESMWWREDKGQEGKGSGQREMSKRDKENKKWKEKEWESEENKEWESSEKENQRREQAEREEKIDWPKIFLRRRGRGEREAAWELDRSRKLAEEEELFGQLRSMGHWIFSVLLSSFFSSPFLSLVGALSL